MDKKKINGMNTLYKYLIAFLIIATISPAYAGNKDRSGQAGASELLINPWARSSGWGNANMAKVRGLEAMWGNVAGTAFTKKTQLIFSQTQWLKGTGTNIFAFGLTQRVGESGVIGLQVMSMSFGEIQITTGNNPDGGRRADLQGPASDSGRRPVRAAAAAARRSTWPPATAP